MKTTFRHCLLVNYAMDPAVLSRSLPRGLTPDTVDTVDGPRAFLSVVVADLEAMRLGFLPRALGSDFTQVVYRAIVRAPTGERGVYFVRSDADDVVMSIAGNVFSNFNFNLADCVWSGRDELRDTAARVLDAAEGIEQRPELERRKWLTTPQLQHDEAGSGSSSTGSAAFMLEPRRSTAADEAAPDPAGVHLSLDLASASLTMPSTSAFRGKDVREAQRYFVELYAALASWPEHDHWSAVRIDRTTWQVISLEPALACVDFMDRSSHFQPGEAVLDSCFYVHALDYHWHAVDTQPFVADAPTDVSTTFFYDGACPVCIRETSHWKRLLQAEGSEGGASNSKLRLHDISGGDVGALGTEFGVTFDDAMRRAHAVDVDGSLRTGVSAFIAAWEHLPRWKWLARLLRSVPMAASGAELAYGAWASARPMLKASAPEAARASPGASCRYVPGQKGRPPPACG